jgi:hypothetical protein
LHKLQELYSNATCVRHADAATMVVNQVFNTVFRPAGQNRKEGLDTTLSTFVEMLAHNPGALAPVIDQIDNRAIDPVTVRKPAHGE